MWYGQQQSAYDDDYDDTLDHQISLHNIHSSDHDYEDHDDDDDDDGSHNEEKVATSASSSDDDGVEEERKGRGKGDDDNDDDDDIEQDATTSFIELFKKRPNHNKNNDSSRQLQSVTAEKYLFTRVRKLKTISEAKSMRTFSNHSLLPEEDNSLSDFINSFHGGGEDDDNDFKDGKRKRPASTDDKKNDEEVNGTSSTDTEGSSSRRPSDINLDKSIVTDVLDKSDERERKLKWEICIKKMRCNTKKGIVSIVIVFSFVLIPCSVMIYLYGSGYFEDSDRVKEKTSRGEIGIFSDHGLYHDHIDYDNDLRQILGQRIQIDEDSVPSYISKNLVSILKETGDPSKIIIQQYNEDEIPFFWKTPFVGGQMERIFSTCYGFVMATDIAKPEGIENADKLGLVDSDFADIVSSSLIHYASNVLFAENDNEGLLFTILRHPIDQTIVSYYDYVSNFDNDYEQISFFQYVQSSTFKSNWLTRTLSNVSTSSQPTLEDLNQAKEILRRKCLIGIYENLERSLELFKNYFQWNFTNIPKEAENINRCVSDVFLQSDNEKYLIYKKIEDWGYNVDIGSDIYGLIAERNEFDIELYWYAFDLHLAQTARIY